MKSPTSLVSGVDFISVPTRNYATAAAFALHVEDIEAARAELESRGVSFTHALDSGVCHMAFFEDPDGNALLLHHRYAPRGSDA